MATTFTTFTRGKLAVLCLLLANVIAFGVLASASPAAANPMDECDESGDWDEIFGCDCIAGGAWRPTLCYGNFGEAYYCLDGRRCKDYCEKSGPDCRKPIPK